MTDERAIDFIHVSKAFKGDFWMSSVTVLDDVTFHVNPGEILGLIGPNGAGKTTAIKILMGLIRPTGGDAKILGSPTGDVRAKKDVGYLPENAYYYDFLRTEEVVDFYGKLFGLSRAQRDQKTAQLLELVGLADRRGVKLRNFSKGMLQRIGIAQALVGDPKLLILDEPMSGLDPIGRREVRDIILRLSDMGKTILLSSHILSDVEAICERVAILIRGKLRAFGSVHELVRARVKSTEVVFRGGGVEEVPPALSGRVRMRKKADQMILVTEHEAAVPEILKWGESLGWVLVAVSPHKESLEDIFMAEVERKT